MLNSIELCQQHCFLNSVELCQQNHMQKSIELCQRHCMLSSVELCQITQHVKSQGVSNQIDGRPLDKSVILNYIFLFLDQHICCGHSKKTSQRDGSFYHLKQMLKLINKCRVQTRKFA